MNAREFALLKHAGQKWGPHYPYSEHLDRVASFFPADSLRWELAHLHDTLEDTNTTYDEIHTYFGINLARKVRLLSKLEDTDIFVYYQAIAKDVDAWSVKLADLEVNLSHCIINLATLPSNNGWGRETECKIKNYARYIHYLLTGEWLFPDKKSDVGGFKVADFPKRNYLMQPGWENFPPSQAE
ncbi:MAG: hypothetical protein WEC39_02490 [Patescibacteria group bacterium]